MVNLVDGERPVDRRRALTTLGILGAMVLANSVLGLPILWSAVGAALAVLLARCVNLKELWRSLDLRLLLVIACSFALGAAVDRTGVAAVVASGLGGLAGSDPFASLVLVYVMAVVFTELLTNNAAAILVFPIAVGVAQQLGVSPAPFVIALMIGASAGFMTPIGYQTNLMVYGPGGYRFGDYVRLGAPLSLVVGLVALWLIPRFFPF
jgi:di/tricarboxylate transporter